MKKKNRININNIIINNKKNSLQSSDIITLEWIQILNDELRQGFFKGILTHLNNRSNTLKIQNKLKGENVQITCHITDPKLLKIAKISEYNNLNYRLRKITFKKKFYF